MNALRNIAALLIQTSGFVLSGAVVFWLAEFGGYWWVLPIFTLFPLTMVGGGLLLACWKCGRATSVSPDENWHNHLVPAVLLWRRCPRCGVQAFAFQ